MNAPKNEHSHLFFEQNWAYFAFVYSCHNSVLQSLGLLTFIKSYLYLSLSF